MPKIDAQMSLADLEYGAFVEKFKPKKTTDDCYTPPNVYEAILGWVRKEYGIGEDVPIVRPFWPGGDYEAYDYPEGCVVVDNPPFSIISKICADYKVARESCTFIRALDAQRAVGKSIYGSGYLLSTKAAAEKAAAEKAAAEKAAATRWQLSRAEVSLIAEMDAREARHEHQEHEDV